MRYFKRVFPVTFIIHFILLFFVLANSESHAWNCPDCGRTGNTGNYCGRCAHPAPWIENNAAATDIQKTVKVGDYITFGHYPQTAEGNDNTPIEWLVLDVQEDKALLISHYGLDCQPYNSNMHEMAPTWEKCTLRTWLNDEFITRAFNANELSEILFTNVDNSSFQGYRSWKTNGGNDTQDRIFLLSYAEVNRYFGVTYSNQDNLRSRVQPNDYAINQGAYTSNNRKTSDEKPAGWWWLRSPGNDQIKAAYVNVDGSISHDWVYHDHGSVRPALWIKTKNDTIQQKTTETADETLSFDVTIEPDHLSAPGPVSVYIRVSNNTGRDMTQPVLLQSPDGAVVTSFGDGGQALIKQGEFVTAQQTWHVTQEQLIDGRLIYTLAYNQIEENGNITVKILYKEVKILQDFKVIIPDLIGTEGTQARVILNTMGFSVYGVSDGISDNITLYVARMDPSPGTSVDPGSAVTVYFGDRYK